MTTDPITWAEISIPALKNNLNVIRQATDNTKTMLVLKADAYGHGALDLAPHLDADALAVARIDEAKNLREHGYTGRLLLLSPLITPQLIETIQDQDIEIVLHSQSAVEHLLSMSLSKDNPVPVWLKVDSGMHRLGLNIDNAETFIDALLNKQGIQLQSLMSHFASADDLSSHQTQEQLSKIQKLHKKYPNLAVCVANSAGVFFHPDAHFDWIRAGIALYGINPSSHETELTKQLIPVMTLKAKVLDIKPIKAGDSVGYNARWTAHKPTRIAVIGIGYGDGFPRHAASGTPVLIKGVEYPLVGTVSMDLITVDIGDADIQVDDVATLWGEGLSTRKVAEFAETIAYELTTRVSQRVKRIIKK
ncbi:MAG: alanine racemase [Cellvibrionales bacterium]|nr:alanine racemase [Cellvibrionales bacterium]